MSEQKKHPHGNDNHGRNHHDAKHDEAPKKKLIHHDWRFWVAIVLMAIGMITYIFSLDESIQPEGDEQPEVPAAAE